MTPEKADEHFGGVVYTDDSAVVRVKRDGQQLHVTVHRRNKEGKELIPHGYFLGSNALTCDTEKY